MLSRQPIGRCSSRHWWRTNVIGTTNDCKRRHRDDEVVTSEKTKKRRGITMRKVIYALAAWVAAGAIGLALAPSATAAVWTANQDAVFVTFCESSGVHDADGPAAEAWVGREIADDLGSGVDPNDESYYIYSNTVNTITQVDADTIVRAAGVAYLGW
jgi:hypothetical protein